MKKNGTLIRYTVRVSVCQNLEISWRYQGEIIKNNNKIKFSDLRSFRAQKNQASKFTQSKAERFCSFCKIFAA